MNYACPGCRKVVVREDRRRREGARLIAVNGARLDPTAVNQAPRVRCACGLIVLLLKGSL